MDNTKYLLLNQLTHKVRNKETNLATIYMLIRSQMSSIMGQIEAKHPELFTLELGSIRETILTS